VARAVSDKFVRVIEKGSFSAVAKERGIGQTAVSKKMSALKMNSAPSLFTAPLDDVENATSRIG
jgi:hypothetical protein